MSVTREAMARALRDALKQWCDHGVDGARADDPCSMCHEIARDLADAALALVRGEQDQARDQLAADAIAWRERAWRERAEAAEELVKAMRDGLNNAGTRMDALRAQLQAAEQERDRQYEFNVEQIATQAQLEAQLQALQREVQKIADGGDNHWCRTIARAALASPPQVTP